MQRVSSETILVIGIVDTEKLKDYLELHNRKVQRQIQKSNEDIRTGRTRPAAELLAELHESKHPKNKSTRRQKKA